MCVPCTWVNGAAKLLNCSSQRCRSKAHFTQTRAAYHHGNIADLTPFPTFTVLPAIQGIALAACLLTCNCRRPWPKSAGQAGTRTTPQANQHTLFQPPEPREPAQSLQGNSCLAEINQDNLRTAVFARLRSYVLYPLCVCVRVYVFMSVCVFT
ncbi:unnamed protein product [Protopolystoma xenopodis]|uniref:Uncharacterized protein n=1 Tax=Protopolystoma xenopodis TaxID=117903 RepID=A0A3S5B2B5_9PLAT|nr:unnamed protein product [Protopolystoma xenopodis]